MKKTAVIYWSGTGNTEAMAKAVLKGMRSVNPSAEIYTPADVDASLVTSLNAIAFGCPAMGSESLEDGEFEPMFESVKSALSGKNIALFGSYGWGDGEWMRNWEDDCKSCGATLACDSVICNDAPEDDTISACTELGKTLAE